MNLETTTPHMILWGRKHQNLPRKVTFTWILPSPGTLTVISGVNVLHTRSTECGMNLWIVIEGFCLCLQPFSEAPVFAFTGFAFQKCFYRESRAEFQTELPFSASCRTSFQALIRLINGYMLHVGLSLMNLNKNRWKNKRNETLLLSTAACWEDRRQTP